MDKVNSQYPGWSDLQQGIHICSIYRSKQEQFTPMIPFFLDGLDKEQKCLYVVDENTPEDIKNELGEVDATTKDNTLREFTVLSSSQTYVSNGEFDPDSTIDRFDALLRTTLGEGFAGMRAAAEMSWIVSSNIPLTKLFEYETKLNSFYPSRKLLGVCQFDEATFTKEFLIEMIRSHPYIILYGKLYANKYFFSDPKFVAHSRGSFTSSDYETILSLFLDDVPLTDLSSITN